MMFTYENGLLIAFLFWVLGIIRIMMLATSKTQKNLKLVGKRMSYNLGVVVDYDYKQETFLWRLTKFIFINVLLPLPFVLLSWVFVIYNVGIYLYVFFKDMGAPEKIKEYRWKIRNVDLSFDQMIKEIMKINDQDPKDFDKFKNEMMEYLKHKQNDAFN